MRDDYYAMYGQKLKNAVKKSGLSQTNLAERLGVAQSTVSTWYNSIYPPLEVIEKVCAELEIPVWQFFAPEDLIIPGLDPDEARYMRLFKEVPTNVQAMMIESNTLMYEAYLEGKKEK